MRVLSAVLGFVLLAAVVGWAARSAGQGGGYTCPSIMQPVCAEDASGIRTFPNSCLAEAAGAKIVRPGRCEGSLGSNLAQSRCSREYLPVCGERGGQRRTFLNECEAALARFKVIAEAEC